MLGVPVGGGGFMNQRSRFGGFGFNPRRPGGLDINPRQQAMTQIADNIGQPPPATLPQAGGLPSPAAPGIVAGSSTPMLGAGRPDFMPSLDRTWKGNDPSINPGIIGEMKKVAEKRRDAEIWANRGQTHKARMFGG